MKVLYIYRNPAMGFSIGKVFKTIENEVSKYTEVDNLYLPVANYTLQGLYKNIRAAQKACKQEKYDIVHITGAEHYLIPFLTNQKVVVTVHDLESILRNKKGINLMIKRLLFIKVLRFADYLTFISAKSKREAFAMTLLDESRCCIIHNAIDDSFTYYPPKNILEKKTALHIGTLPHKNLERVIEAINGLNIHLRIIGKLSNKQLQLLKKNNTEYSNACKLSDKQILQEYINCDIVSFPSLYEGFGMPIIEGQAIGRPVITSNIEPMTEIGKNSVAYVNPYDTNSIKAGFQNAISNYDFYINKGQINVKTFNVTKIAEQYTDIYKILLKEC